MVGFSFDPTVYEMWPYLTVGASLHIADSETRVSPELALVWLKREAITHCVLITPLAEAVLQLLKDVGTDGLALETVIVGGDKLRLRPQPGLPFAFVNHYGPTENTVVTTIDRNDKAVVLFDGAADEAFVTDLHASLAEVHFRLFKEQTEQAETRGRLADGNPETLGLLRSLPGCVFGNPFRPIALDPSWLTSNCKGNRSVPVATGRRTVSASGRDRLVPGRRRTRPAPRALAQ